LCRGGVGNAEFEKRKRRQRRHQQTDSGERGAALTNCDCSQPVKDSDNHQDLSITELAGERIHQGVGNDSDNDSKKTLDHGHHIRTNTRVDEENTGDRTRWHKVVKMDAEEKAEHQGQPIAGHDTVMIPTEL